MKLNSITARQEVKDLFAIGRCVRLQEFVEEKGRYLEVMLSLVIEPRSARL